VLFSGVVSAQTEKVVEFFLEREAAEAMIGEVREASRHWRRSCGSRHRTRLLPQHVPPS
jgi:hypothetical protein